MSLLEEQSQIIELTDLTNEQILVAIKKLLEENDFERFTLFVKKKPRSETKKLTKIAQPLMRMQSLDCNLSQFSHLSSLSIRDARKYSKIPELKVTQMESTQSQMFKAAMKQQKQAIPQSQFPQIIQALSFYKQNQYENALDCLIAAEMQLQKEITKLPQKQRNKSLKESKKYSQISFHLGNCYFRQRNIDSAIRYYELEFNQENQKQKGQRFNNLGTCYAIKKQIQLSLKYFSEALKIYQKYPDIDCSNLLNNIGIIYMKSEMYSVAAQYFSNSIISRKISSPNNQQMLYYSYFKMGICFKLCKKYQESLKSLNFALNLAQKGIGNYYETLKQLALLYQNLEKWTQVLSCYQKMSDWCSDRKISQGYIYQRVALVHQKIGNQVQHDNFMSIAYEEYRRDGNQRKMSDLCNFGNKQQG